MMLKEAESFDVPTTNVGLEFLEWWSHAPSEKRDNLMKTAYSNNVSILEALAQQLEDA